MKTIAVFLRHSSRWNPDKPVREQSYWAEHARFMDELFDARKIILAGPFADDTGSMVIMAAESAEAARSIFSKDPWSEKDILVAEEFKEWTIFLDAAARGRDD